MTVKKWWQAEGAWADWGGGKAEPETRQGQDGGLALKQNSGPKRTLGHSECGFRLEKKKQEHENEMRLTDR